MCSEELHRWHGTPARMALQIFYAHMAIPN